MPTPAPAEDAQLHPDLLHLLQPTPAPHWMLDLETLGTDPGAVVVSIGLVRFTPCERPGQLATRLLNPGAIQHYRLQLEEQFAAGRSVDFSTCKWWLRHVHPATAASEIFGTPRHPAGGALLTLAAYTGDYVPGESRIWCRGTDFDMPVLKSLRGQFAPDVDFPWHFSDARDLRTHEELLLRTLDRPAIERWQSATAALRDTLAETHGSKHSAATDAAAQAYALVVLEHEARQVNETPPIEPRRTNPPEEDPGIMFAADGRPAHHYGRTIR